jgi:hypothetical protein
MAVDAADVAVVDSDEFAHLAEGFSDAGVEVFAAEADEEAGDAGDEGFEFDALLEGVLGPADFAGDWSHRRGGGLIDERAARENLVDGEWFRVFGSCEGWHDRGSFARAGCGASVGKPLAVEGETAG